MKAHMIYPDWQRLTDGERFEVSCRGTVLADAADRYSIVATDDAPADDPDFFFVKYNRHDGNPLPDFKNRSMSVGDIVVYEDLRVFVCKGSGWEERPDLANWARAILSRPACTGIPYGASECPSCDRKGA